SELLGKRLHDVLPADDATRFLEVVVRALDSREIQHLEYQLEIGGQEVWFAATASPTAEGTVVWLARDVTEQRRAEAALRASEAGHRELLGALPVIIYWVSPEAPYTPTYISPGIEMLGYTVSEWMSVADMWLQRMHPGDRDRLVAETEAAAAAGAPVESEYRMI